MHLNSTVNGNITVRRKGCIKNLSQFALAALIAAGPGTASYSQETPTNNDLATADAAKVYIDCSSCDFDFIKTQITFVNFVRDRAEADIHILITTQNTAAGGQEYTIEFIGQKTYSMMVDTLRCYSQTAESKDDIRKELAKTLKLGLIRYVARTPLSNDISITYNKPILSTASIDKWNYWVFSINANTNFSGEKSRNHVYLYSKFNARRTTEKNRITFSIWGNYSENNYSYGGTKTKSISRSKGTDAGLCVGIDDHWSLGLGTEFWSSMYSNYVSVWELYPSLEYNVFPYGQSTRRQLRMAYFADLRYNDYEYETIYDKYEEWFGQEYLSVTLELIEQWGSLETYVTASHNFPETSRNRIWVGGDFSLNLVKGLSLTIDVGYARIHDQINLAKGSVSQEDLLLQRRQLATSYEYNGSIGISYSFGSIFTNVVNPRFGG